MSAGASQGEIGAVGVGPIGPEKRLPPPMATVPHSPQDLSASSASGRVILTWYPPNFDGGAPIINYNVYRGTSSNGEVFLVPVGIALTYTDNNVINGQTYFYRVSAMNSVGEGPTSNEASASPGTVPSAPTQLPATASNAQVALAWLAPSNNGGFPITGYRVYRGTTSGGETLLASPGNVLNYTNVGLTNGVTYYYKISALNSKGESALSNERSATPRTIPSAPQNLVATEGDSSVTLTWSAPASNGGASITAYKVYGGTSSGGQALLATLGNVLTFTDSGLTNGQTYYYQVSAVNAAGEGPRSAEDSAIPAAVPLAPTSLSATTGNAYVFLSWSAPSYDGGSPVTGYKVYRGVSLGDMDLLATLGNVLTLNDTRLTNGQTYIYKVSAVNAAGEGPLSETVQATPATVPGAPTVTAATPGNGTITLVWAPPASDGGSDIIGYNVYRGNASGEETLLIVLDNVLTYQDTGLVNGQTYYYTVTAVNSLGEGRRASENSAKPVSVPSAPVFNSAVPGNGRLTLSWSSPSTGGSRITNYNVYRGNASGEETLLIVLGNMIIFTDTGLVNGQTYYYRVSAVNAIGEGPLSAEISASPAGVPSVPLSFTVTPGNAQIALSWSAPGDDGGTPVIGYKIYHCTDTGEEYLLTTLGNVLTYTNTGLTNGYSYGYSVSAVNAVGEGAHTERISAIPVTKPAALASIFASPGNGQVVLSWSSPSSNGGSAITNYKIYRGNASGEEVLLTTLGDIRTYTDTGLTNGQTYYYRISAVNSAGESALSNEIRVVPSESPGIVLPLGIVGFAAAIGAIWFLTRKRP